MKSGTICLLIVLLMNYAQPSEAQFFVNGESPGSIRWMQINTPQYQVVYPMGIQKEAELLISNLEKTAALTLKPYHRPAKKVPILLNMTSVRSNGFVTWTPRRMELIVTPPQDSYAQDWMGQLSLHEYRHVVQISQLDQGFLSALKYVTGEIAMGGGSAIMPSWYYEGDAVLNETRLSAAGRGRSAGFEMPLRTLLLGKRKLYPFSKAKLGSYKDFVPNQYQYGYQMVSWLNEHYGQDIWPEAIDYASKKAYLISPLSVFFIMKHKTGKKLIYRNSMDSIKNLYNKQEEAITYSDYLKINRRKSGTYTNYRFPQLLNNGKVLALKSGIDQRNYFVVIDSSGEETRILTTGAISGLKTDMHGNRILWDEIVSDPRWELRNYSEIRIFDLSKNKLYNLTGKTRYFCPDFSPDGNTIAVSETDLQNTHYLTLISAKNGKSIRQILSPENREVTFPEWTSDRTIIVITISSRGKQIEQIDISTGQWTVLLPYTRFDISEPLHYRNYILFRSAYTTIENIYAFDIKRQKLFQVTFSRFGAYNPSISPDSSELLFSTYTDRGFDVTRISLDSSLWKQIPISDEPYGIWPAAKRSDYPENLLSDSLGESSHQPVPYRKLAHLFHVHSWLPFYVPLGGMPRSDNTLPVELGFMLFSQNLLSTFISSIGYHYTNGNHYITPKITWRGWYPVFELTGQMGGPTQSFTFPEGIKPSGRFSTYYNYHLKTYVPLFFDRGKYITYLLPQLEYEHNSTHFFINGNEHNGLHYMHAFLYATRYLRMSQRDLFPRLGGYLSSSYTVTPGDEGQLGSMFSLQGTIYLPGIGPHHHLLLKGGWQKQNPGLYYLSINRIDFPRGYTSTISAEMKTFSVDYALPLAYPDWSSEPIIYLKRIRADVFYDWSYGKDILEGKDKWYTGTYQSAGGELLADFHAGRIIFPFSAGVRMGYLFNTNRMFTEFLFHIQMR
jgi:hypothetical protein